MADNAKTKTPQEALNTVLGLKEKRAALKVQLEALQDAINDVGHDLSRAEDELLELLDIQTDR